ncbi:prolyl endopeptidase-like protein [Thamnocephalis sphaerospora]|uniref:Prolyl endopeptidase n=1 Tax=Thamnocephalis sphaerospora TaxID=78915 RepID=A0A4P9XXL2_9FUNG|nr:prolyl endopeptidase-like protein [Thamnocephalis sphaerospora]|eukprot:RKP11067.1 prolyl endopeptidase-like protein [Thamnocephalis sphaerospora]
MTKHTWTYPTIRRDDTVETLHGHTIADPYRWLEDPDSEETKAFVEAQNAITFDYIGKCSQRGDLKEKLTKLYDYARSSCPFKRGSSYYYFHNSGLQAQSVLYQLKSLDAEKTMFFDPNVLEKDGTAALNTYSFSDSGHLFGYGISRSGSDWMTLHVRVAADGVHGKAGADLVDEIQWAKFTGITWSHDDQGFFYGRFPEPSVEKDKAGTETGSNLNAMLYYHRLGTPQSEDQLIVRDPDHPHYMFGAEVTDDGRWLVVTTTRDCDPVNRVWVAPLEDGGRVPKQLEFRFVVDNFDAAYDYITNDGSLFYFKTNADAPRYKVVTYDLDRPERGFVDLIPQHDKDVLDTVGVVAGDKLFVHYLRDVKSVLDLHQLQTGEKVRNLPLPIGSLAGLSGRQRDRELFFKFASYLNPGVIYRYDADADAISTFLTTEVAGFDGDAFETKQVFVRSKDGVEFPMFITARKGIPLDGSRPAILYGYGGFNIPLQPSFSPAWVAFAKYFDGVVAIANLRGGGEYGEAWHKDGMLHKKQNVFDDFQSAAKYLADHHYTQPNRLAIHGGSNGGLLVGACVNQAPELFGCGLAAVGVMDMLRFHKFTIGHAWKSDYGDPDVKKDFEYIRAYSPLHNVRADVTYPSVLLTTSDHDDRVVPLHSYKLIAELQHTLPDNKNPLMIRVETKAGHGAGKPTAKQIEEWVDKFAFIATSLGISWHL